LGGLRRAVPTPATSTARKRSFLAAGIVGCKLLSTAPALISSTGGISGSWPMLVAVGPYLEDLALAALALHSHCQVAPGQGGGDGVLTDGRCRVIKLRLHITLHLALGPRRRSGAVGAGHESCRLQ
jgi:hypothetical protein